MGVVLEGREADEPGECEERHRDGECDDCYGLAEARAACVEERSEQRCLNEWVREHECTVGRIRTALVDVRAVCGAWGDLERPPDLDEVKRQHAKERAVHAFHALPPVR